MMKMGMELKNYNLNLGNGMMCHTYMKYKIVPVACQTQIKPPVTHVIDINQIFG